MKNLLNKILIISILILASCSGGASKFAGKWKPLKGNPILSEDTFVEITRDGDHYNLTNSGKPAIMSILQYDKTLDALTGDANGIMLVVKYDKATKHITMGPKNLVFMSQIIELEKAE
jgi:hypothetical protein